MRTPRPNWNWAARDARWAYITGALVAIPFGAVVALQTGSLIKQLGAESFTGATSVLATVQQAAPVVT
ncbi:ABC transporter permease, partial [Nocardia cyriacigeorgica]|uniref:ABC transporter permease n=1 Tax=Nocardia cyriacigeorgica TaxID=135487 RepID=UPI003CC80EAE